MRVLVTIPHYFRRAPGGDGHYQSERAPEAVRAAMVTRCIASLHQSFGSQQVMLGDVFVPCNAGLAMELDVVLVVHGEDHLVPLLPPALFKAVRVAGEPRHLGFACQALMRERAGQYDWFVYLEDDIEVADPLTFLKLRWFQERFGASALLQPHRFEVSSDLSVLKLYVDGELTNVDAAASFQDISVRPRVAAEAFGRPVGFERTANPHAGCFFLDARQLARVAASPLWGMPTAEFIGPLELAATLMIMRNFEVYKPMVGQAAFFEVRHLGRRYLVASEQAA